jgi:hemerythrin HHE cation binding domain-containing protein
MTGAFVARAEDFAARRRLDRLPPRPTSAVSMTSLYASPADHVAVRPGLSDDLRKLLLAIPKDEWQGHPNYWRGADFLQAVHRAILSESGAFANGLQELFDLTGDELERGLLLNELRPLGRHLIGHAHVHHHVENDQYFPRFKQAYPRLARPIDLLDGDHRALEENLAAVEGHLRTLSAETADRDTIGRALDDARALDRLLQRHIADEEDIVIPVLLQDR